MTDRHHAMNALRRRYGLPPLGGDPDRRTVYNAAGEPIRELLGLPVTYSELIPPGTALIADDALARFVQQWNEDLAKMRAALTATMADVGRILDDFVANERDARAERAETRARRARIAAFDVDAEEKRLDDLRTRNRALAHHHGIDLPGDIELYLRHRFRQELDRRLLGDPDALSHFAGILPDGHYLELDLSPLPLRTEDHRP